MKKHGAHRLVGLIVTLAMASTLLTPPERVNATEPIPPPLATPTNALPDSVYEPPIDPVEPHAPDEQVPAPLPGSPQEAEQVAIDAMAAIEQSQIEASHTAVDLVSEFPIEPLGDPLESGDPGIEEFEDPVVEPAFLGLASVEVNLASGSSGCSPGPSPAYNATVETITTVTSVTNNAAGSYTLRIRNTGTTSWPAGWSVATQIYNSSTELSGPLHQRSTVATALATNATANVTVSVAPLTPGSWFASWEISVPPVGPLRSLGVCSVSSLPVYNLAPSLSLKSPLEFGTVTTNRPFLNVTGDDVDAYPSGATLTFRYRVCANASLTEACQVSGWTTSQSWQPPQTLSWATAYYWSAEVSDGVSTLSALSGHPDGYKFTVVVPAADEWRQVGNGLGMANAFGVVLPYGVFVHSERDAQVDSVNVPLFVERTFSTGALDTQGAFGSGWMSVFDTAYVRESPGLYRVTYTDGRQEAFGQNCDTCEFVGRPELGVTNRLSEAVDGTVTVAQASGEQLVFDGFGQLNRVEYPQLGSLQFQYSSGNVSKITQQPSGRAILVEWSLTGQNCTGSSRPTRPYVTSIRVEGELSGWTYNYSCNRLIKMTDPIGHETTYASTGSALNATNPSGVQIADAGAASAWQSHTFGAQRRTVTVDVPGATSRTISIFRMNPSGSGQLDYLNNFNEWGGYVVSYCETRASATVETCNGLPITMRFDELNRLRAQSWSHPEQAASYTSVERRWMYSASTGQLTSMEDENGRLVSYTYDGWGNLRGTYMFRADGTQVTSSSFYLPYSGPASPTRVTGSVITPHQAESTLYGGEFSNVYFYDNDGKLIRREGPPTQGAPLGEITAYTYTGYGSAPAVDGAGALIPGRVAPANLLRTETRGPLTVTYSYNPQGDLTLISDSTGRTTTRDYDNRGLLVSETVRSSAGVPGAQTVYERDELGRVTAEAHPCATNRVTGAKTQRIVTYSFRADGRPTALSERALDCDTGIPIGPPRTEITSYNAYGQIATQKNALGGVTTFTYSAVNPEQVTSIKDVRNRTTSFTYTQRGNRVATVFSDVGTPGAATRVRVAAYEYDNAGRLIAEYDALSRRTTYEYTSDGHVAAAFNGSTEMWRRTFDGAGHVLSEIVGGRERTDYRYDTEGRLEGWTIDPGGVNRTHSIVRDEYGRVTGAAVSAGGVEERTTSQLNAAGHAVSLSVALSPGVSVTTLTGRSAFGQVTSTTDPRGQLAGASPASFRSSQLYDELNRLTSVMGPPVTVDNPNLPDFVGLIQATERATTEVGYNAFGEVTEVRSPSGLLTEFQYDIAGNLTLRRSTALNESGVAETRVEVQNLFSPAGDLAQSTDSRGGVTNNTYDIAGNLIRTEGPIVAGQRPTITATFDHANQLTSTTSPTGAVVKFAYDKFGRVVAKTEEERRQGATPLPYVTSFEYDTAGNLLKVTSPALRVLRKEFNGAGEVVLVWDPGVSNPTRYFYDLAGRVTKVTDPAGRSVETTFDRAGRVTSTAAVGTDGSRLTTSYTHDANGNILSMTDPRGTVTTYSVDAANRRTSMVQPVTATSNIRTEAGYDVAGNRVRTRDGRGFDTWTQYNQQGLLTRIVEPSTPTDPGLSDRSWSFRYDAAFNQTSDTSPGGSVVTRTYDALNRMTSEVGQQVNPTDPASARRDFTYDLVGNLVGAATETHSQSFVWSDRGLLTSSAGSSGNSQYGYDADGLTTLRTVGNLATTFSYDAAGRENTFADQATGAIITTAYSAASGELTTKSWPGGATTPTYDTFGRLATSTTVNSSNVQVQKITYGHDANSNVTSKYVELGTQNGGIYQYDLANRLTGWAPRSANGTTGSIYYRNYQWDNSGNSRVAEFANVVEYRWAYDARNRLAATSVDYDGYFFPYEVETSAAGQVTYLGEPDRNLVYDALGQLVGDQNTAYKYDALGRLLQRTAAGATQTFAYAGTESEPYRAPNNLSSAETVARSSTGQIASSTLGPRIALTDAHGDVLGGVATTGAGAGALMSSVGYEPFGELWSGSASPSQQRSGFGFQGSWTDSQTGSVWMGTRWYDPGTASFLSRDSTRFDGFSASELNLYGYANGNPLKYTDPDGRTPAILIAGVAVPVWVVATTLAALTVGAYAAFNNYMSGGDLTRGWNSFAQATGATFAASASSAGAFAADAWSFTTSVATSIATNVSAAYSAQFVSGPCYIYASCSPPGATTLSPPGSLGKPGPLGSLGGGSNAAPFRPDVSIDFALAGSALKTVIVAGAATVSWQVAGSRVAERECGFDGTLQSCVLPGPTITSACASQWSPAGLCSPVVPLPRSGAGTGATAPVGPIAAISITASATLTSAISIAASIGAPRPPEEPEQCVPEPDLDSATPVELYEVGLYSDLKKRPRADGVEIHHVPQGHPARQVIPLYNYRNAPAIALTKDEHRDIPNLRGQYSGSIDELLDRDLSNLREITQAPPSSLNKLSRLVKEMYQNGC